MEAHEGLNFPPGIPLSFSRGMKGGRRQLLLSLAFGDVAPDGFCADMPCGANVVGACPELIAPGSFCQCRKCLARHLRAVALEQPDDLRWGVLRRGTDEAMDVIDVGFERQQPKAMGFAAVLD